MKYVSVALDKQVENWEYYVKELNRVIPTNVGIAFDIGDDPVRHLDFCPFMAHLERPWKIRTTLLGPGYDCLRVRSDELWRCEEIVAVYVYPNSVCGVYEWLKKPIRLAEVGYNIKTELPVPVDLRWVGQYARKSVSLNIRKPTERKVLVFGLAPRGEPRSCNGELACIWGGKYYPCPHCVTGWNIPVYAYGEFPEDFSWRGQEQCFLKDCPLEDRE